MIRSSKHNLNFCNKNKKVIINNLLVDFRSLVQDMINYLWTNEYNKNNCHFDISKNKLDLPNFLDSELCNSFQSSYTARFKQLAAKQAIAMLSSATEKRRQQLWKLKELQSKNENTKYLQRAISIHPLVKPNADKINLEFDNRFVNFKFDKQNKFLCFIRLTSIKKGTSLNIPITINPVYSKWNNLGKLKTSIRLSDNHINLLFDVVESEKKTTGEIVSCDQGLIDMVTFSDNQKVSKYQGKFLLKDVIERLSRKKKGSKSFKRTQEFRKNLVNWSINQLNFNNIKELRIEKLHQVGKGKSKSRMLSHWAYTLINDKLKKVSEEKGFLLREMPNEFRSQRCSKCGLVRKANRKGKTFLCKSCGHTEDSDKNAASNLLLDLIEVPYWVRLKKYNIKGFYWKPEGLYNLSQELLVPDTLKVL